MANAQFTSQPGSAETRPTDYVVVFSDHDRPKDYSGKEYKFTANSDIHAEDRMDKEYPAQKWTLYRLDRNGQRREIHHHFGEK